MVSQAKPGPLVQLSTAPVFTISQASHLSTSTEDEDRSSSNCPQQHSNHLSQLLNQANLCQSSPFFHLVDKFQSKLTISSGGFTFLRFVLSLHLCLSMVHVWQLSYLWSSSPIPKLASIPTGGNTRHQGGPPVVHSPAFRILCQVSTNICNSFVRLSSACLYFQLCIEFLRPIACVWNPQRGSQVPLVI